jgi:hypothetical protein
VDDDAIRHLRPPPLADIGDEGADHLLHALVDVGAVKGGDPGVQKRLHIRNRLGGAHLAMVAGQLPATFQHPGNPVPGAQVYGFHAHASSFQ